MTIFLVTAAIAVLTVIDQLIKIWAIANLQGQPARPFLQIGSFDWMHLRYLENRGAAFSMLSGNRGFLIVFPLIMIAVCLYVLHRHGKGRRWLQIAMTLIAAGGLGNLIDRIFRGGSVVDYLDFQLCNFAVFNFADICVTVGVGLVVIGLLFIEKEEPEAKKLKKAERIPFAHTVAALPEAGTLPLAGELPEAEAAPLREDAEDAEAAEETEEHAGA
jgi:signal peptidase II